MGAGSRALGPSFCCLLRCISRELGWKQSSQDSNWHADMGCKWLNLYITGSTSLGPPASPFLFLPVGVLYVILPGKNTVILKKSPSQSYANFSNHKYFLTILLALNVQLNGVRATGIVCSHHYVPHLQNFFHHTKLKQHSRSNNFSFFSLLSTWKLLIYFFFVSTNFPILETLNTQNTYHIWLFMPGLVH